MGRRIKLLGRLAERRNLESLGARAPNPSDAAD
jgi:hypothetical protein